MATSRREATNVQGAATLAGLLLAAAALQGCNLNQAMATCAECGEVRSITPRPLRSEIRLLTDAPQTVRLLDTGQTPLVYDVRVRMDRGGSRDFVLSSDQRLRVGDRVEIRNGALVPHAAALTWS